jgi:hypothetical protein
MHEEMISATGADAAPTSFARSIFASMTGPVQFPFQGQVFPCFGTVHAGFRIVLQILVEGLPFCAKNIPIDVVCSHKNFPPVTLA